MTRFIQIASNPTPANASVFQFQTSTEGLLRGAFFGADEPRGTVVLTTGWSEFIEKYFEAIGDLQARGFNVAMMDWRGQGLSERHLPEETKWVGYFDLIRSDLEHFSTKTVPERFDGPYVFLSHSMGGVPGLMLLAEGNQHFRCAVLSAPLTRLFPGPLNGLAKAAGEAAAFLGMSKQSVFGKNDHGFTFEGNIFTSDRARHERFRDLQLAAPEAANGRPTYGWVRAALDASDRLHKEDFFKQLKTPTLIISAGDDKQIDGSDHAIIAGASDMISCETIDGALHEILVERNEIRDTFWRRFGAFTDHYLTP